MLNFLQTPIHEAKLSLEHDGIGVKLSHMHEIVAALFGFETRHLLQQEIRAFEFSLRDPDTVAVLQSAPAIKRASELLSGFSSDQRRTVVWTLIDKVKSSMPVPTFVGDGDFIKKHAASVVAAFLEMDDGAILANARLKIPFSCNQFRYGDSDGPDLLESRDETWTVPIFAELHHAETIYDKPGWFYQIIVGVEAIFEKRSRVLLNANPYVDVYRASAYYCNTGGNGNEL